MLLHSGNKYLFSSSSIKALRDARKLGQHMIFENTISLTELMCYVEFSV